MQHPTKQTTENRERRRLNSILLVSAACAALAAGSVPAAAGAGAGHDRHEFPIAAADFEARHAKMFGRLDSNSDGEITLEEFAAARGTGDWPRRWRDGVMRYREHGYRRGHGDGGGHRADREEIEADIFAILDTDGDGQLSAAEYSTEKQHAARKEVAAVRLFEHLDTDANGTLSAQEFPPNHLQNLDADGDGEITREEMRNGMRKRHTDAS